MYVSSGTRSYDSPVYTTKIIIDKVTKEKETSHYGEIIPLTSRKEAIEFFSTKGYSFNNKEIEKNISFQEDEMLVYFFVQIPKGYEAFKRNNIQGILPNEKDQILLTDNFYFYGSRPNIFYCNIDIKREETVTQDHLFSFYFSISSTFSSLVTEDTIRLIYQLNE